MESHLCRPASLAPKIPTISIRDSTSEPPHRAWTDKGFYCRQQEMLGGTPGVADAIEIERWRGPATLDRAGPLQDNGASAPSEPSARGRGLISVLSFSAMKPPEDNELIMIDS